MAGSEPFVALRVHGDVPHVVAGQAVLGVEDLYVGAVSRVPAHDASGPGARPYDAIFDEEGLHIIAVGIGGPDLDAPLVSEPLGNGMAEDEAPAQSDGQDQRQRQAHRDNELLSHDSSPYASS
jgi:hypothetical protein